MRRKLNVGIGAVEIGIKSLVQSPRGVEDGGPRRRQFGSSLLEHFGQGGVSASEEATVPADAMRGETGR